MNKRKEIDDTDKYLRLFKAEVLPVPQKYRELVNPL